MNRSREPLWCSICWRWTGRGAGAALMPVILWFEGDDWGVQVHEEIPVPAGGDSKQKAAAMMQEVARLFEAGIRAHPQDWHMLQRVFVADLDPERLPRAAGS